MNAREKYLADRHEQVQREFSRHLIAEESDVRWLLRQPREKGWDDPERRWSGFMWTEVVCLAHGGILVEGDIDPVVFRYGPANPIARIHWMGGCKNAWDHYFREKACIGMGGKGFGTCLDEWIPEVAICDVEELIEDIRDERDICDLDAESIKKMDALRDDVIGELRSEDCTREQFCRTMYDLGYWEGLGYYGRVPSHRMFTAHAALSRLSKLLEKTA